MLDMLGNILRRPKRCWLRPDQGGFGRSLSATSRIVGSTTHFLFAHYIVYDIYSELLFGVMHYYSILFIL